MYWNVCTGWSWIWEGHPQTGRYFEPGTQVGVCFDSPGDGAVMTTSWHFDLIGGTYPGYSFSATMGIYAADPDRCPVGLPLASQVPYFSQYQWSQYTWDIPVPDSFVLAVTWHEWPYLYTHYVRTDHPAAGPTGPPACGTCYPTTREARSFVYHDGVEEHRPGLTFFDGVCDAELIWHAQFNVGMGVEESSWGRVKSLYR
jgi:hypothetical protein